MDSLKAEIKELKTDLKKKDDKIKAMEIKINESEQYSRNKNIEIHNVEEDDNENLEKVVINVAKELGVSLENSEIEIVHRVNSRNKKHPRPILVQMLSRKKRNEIIEKKKTKTVKAKDIGKKGSNIIYVNENISPFFKSKLWEAKQKYEGSYKYVWFSKNKILKRKTDNSKVEEVNLFEME